MESFHWDSCFETGLHDVDEQHKYLVEVINRFGELLVENELKLDDMESVFKELAAYAEYHFQEEEGLMSRIGIDERHKRKHEKSHQDFLQEVTFMHADMAPGQFKEAQNLFIYLTHWLAYHILGTDQDMGRQLKAIEAGSTARQAYAEEERRADAATEPLLVALDGLFQQVSERNRQLIELNLSLEEKVAQRTRALSEANLKLEELALTDSLTTLPNRRNAMRHLTSLWEEVRLSQQPFACMMIDADHFKEVNDSYGHDAGDMVLQSLAKTIQHAVRSDDVVSRLGGDEFFVICPQTDREGGAHVAELIRQAVAALSVNTGDGVWHGSVSIGLAVWSPEMVDYEELMKKADNGVYAAKRDGQNCVRSVD